MASLKKIRKPSVKNLTVKVCVGTGGLAAGGQEVMNSFSRKLRSLGIKADIAKKCVKKTGCRGCCSKDVLVDISMYGTSAT